MILFLLPVGSALIASGYSASLKKAKKNTYINKHKQKVNSRVVRSKTSGLGVYGCVISDIFCNCNEKYDLRNMNFPVPRFSAIIYGKHAICGLR